MYISSESWINKLSVDVWCVRIEQYLAEIHLRVQKKCKHLRKFLLHPLTKIHFWYIYGRKCTKYLHGTWAFWHKNKNRSFWPILCVVGYCHWYTWEICDWFCGLMSEKWSRVKFKTLVCWWVSSADMICLSVRLLSNLLDTLLSSWTRGFVPLVSRDCTVLCVCVWQVRAHPLFVHCGCTLFLSAGQCNVLVNICTCLLNIQGQTLNYPIMPTVSHFVFLRPLKDQHDQNYWFYWN